MAHVVRRGWGSMLRVKSVEGRDVRRTVDSRAQVKRKRNASAMGTAAINLLINSANMVDELPTNPIGLEC